MSDARLVLARRMGVVARYKDQTGTTRDTSVETAVALLAAMGIDTPTERLARAYKPEASKALPKDIITDADTVPPLDIAGDWNLTLETGETREGRGALPVLPLGIHTLRAGARRWTLLAAPPALPLPRRDWGVIAPLYGLSDRGIGDFDDLHALGLGLAKTGAGFLGLNPVHAGFPTAPDVFSPYTPSHRRRLNVMHLPGAEGRPGALIDYGAEIPARMQALRAAYDAWDGSPGFDAYLDREGDSLQRFALHQALSERHGAFWNTWPASLQDPQSGAARTARAELATDLRFHAWLQWCAEAALTDTQQALRAAGMSHGLYLDLAVGTHPHGAETWEDRGSFAFGASLGAPPDAFSADGQNWALAPFNPQALRACAYAPLAETLRRQLLFSGLLRIDHILGFERAFWVPDAAPGAYVKMPRDAMLAVIRIEAARANASIVGEDLGNIPKGLRGALEASGILGCRVAIFERARWSPPRFRKASAYPDASIASFSTHDLPTWQGWRTGADIGAHARIGNLDDTGAAKAQADRSAEVAAFDRMLADPSLDAMHGFLAETPARLVALQAENLLGIAAQPNLPGTIDEYPNWRMRLPVSPEALSCHDALKSAARIMANAGRQGDRR